MDNDVCYLFFKRVLQEIQDLAVWKEIVDLKVFLDSQVSFPSTSIKDLFTKTINVCNYLYTLMLFSPICCFFFHGTQKENF